MDAADKAKQEYTKTASEKIQTAEKRVTEANTLLETEKGKPKILKPNSQIKLPFSRLQQKLWLMRSISLKQSGLI